MVTSNSTKELINIEAMELFITESLLKGENVVIPDFGHLEVKSFVDKRVVLFESTGIEDSFIQIISSAGEKEKKEINALCTIISLPLKKGKVVNLPKVGVFQPIKMEKGEIRVSFVSSVYLRKLMNKENEKEKAEEIIETKAIKENIRYVYQTVEKAPDIHDSKNETHKVQKIEIITDPIRPPESNVTPEEKQEQPVKTNAGNDSFLEPETKLPESQKVDTGNQLVLNEFDDTKKARSISLKGILLFILLGITILGGTISTIYFRYNKKSDKLTTMSESINLPTLAEKYYGHPAFWIYIYEKNADKLSSPINISKDVPLVIPDLKTEYDVDVTDSMEIHRASIIADIILKEQLKKK